MTAKVGSISFDCASPYPLAQFWSEVTGWALDGEPAPDDDEVGLTPPEGHPMMLFLRVPEQKSVKNRVHLDLVPADRTRDEEVARLVGLGATEVADQRRPNGSGWVVLADPEGNEFCVERGPVDRQRAQDAAAKEAATQEAADREDAQE